MSSKKEAYTRYYGSDIFNSKPNYRNQEKKFMKLRVKHPMYDSTREIIFNLNKEKRINRNKDTKDSLKNQILSKSEIRRKNNYDKTYRSDIFNQRKVTSSEKKKGVKRFTDETNKPTCLNGMGDEKEYIKDLKKYTKTHRAEKKEYIPVYSLHMITPQERYYREHYLNHSAFPELNDTHNRSQEILDTKLINNYIYRRKNLNKDLIVYNNVGADKKGNKGEISVRTKKFFRKKPLALYEGRRNFVDPLLYPSNSCKINKQIQLESHIFPSENEKNPKEEAKIINNRIQKDKRRYYNVDIFGRPRPKVNVDSIKSDRNLYGSIHTKWNRTNLDWTSPECQIIFNNTSKDRQFQTARQRQLNEYSNSQNIDILTGVEKEAIIYSYNSRENDDKGKKKFDAIINKIPNLSIGQKLGLKMRFSSLDCNNDKELENKGRSLKNFFANNLHKKSKEKDIVIKVNEKKNKVNNDNNNNNNNNNINNNNSNDNLYHDYVITYSVKGNKFEKLDEVGIQELFKKKGIRAYNVQKDCFDKGNYNTINIKFLGNDDKNQLYNKVKKVQDELRKENYKINIEKKKVKNHGIKSGKIVCNPRVKGGTMYVNMDKSTEGSGFKKIPNDAKNRKDFSKQFAQINYKYKRSFL